MQEMVSRWNDLVLDPAGLPMSSNPITPVAFTDLLFIMYTYLSDGEMQGCVTNGTGIPVLNLAEETGAPVLIIREHGAIGAGVSKSSPPRHFSIEEPWTSRRGQIQILAAFYGLQRV